MEVWHRGRTTLSKRSLHWYGEVCVGYVLGFVTLYSHVLVNGGGGFISFAGVLGALHPVRGVVPNLFPVLCTSAWPMLLAPPYQNTCRCFSIPYESLTVGSRIIGEGTQEVGQFWTERKEDRRRKKW